MNKIDVKQAIRQKYKGYLPGFVFSFLRRLIHEDELNTMMQLQTEVGGVDFAFKLMDYLAIDLRVVGEERLPDPSERCLFVSNHPLGGADGIALTGVLGRRYEGNIKFFVNDVLLNIPQFSDVFVPVNKYGKQARTHTSAMQEALASSAQVITFPAGLCSRLSDDGQIRDLPWRDSFVRQARRYERTIVPLFFDGVNTPRFYRWARWRKKLKLKFNYELILLPSEFIRSKGSTYTIYVGEPIRPSSLPPVPKEDAAFSRKLYDSVYALPVR